MPAQAFQRLLPRIRAVPPTEYVQLNLDVQPSTSKVIAHMPRVREVRAQIEAMVKLSLEDYDLLEEVTLALSHAHTVYLVVSAPRSLQQLAEEAQQARKVMMRDAESAIDRGLLSKTALESVTGRAGYDILNTELFALVEIFRSNWSRLEGRTGVSFAELQNAELLARRLLAKLGNREDEEESEKQASADRSAAFALFLRSHRYARRLILFARDDYRDADEILPPLYGPRKGRRDDASEEPEEDVEGAAPEASAPAGTAPAEPAPGGTAAPEANELGIIASGTNAPGVIAARPALGTPASMLAGEVLTPGEPGETGLPGVDPFKD